MIGDLSVATGLRRGAVTMIINYEQGNSMVGIETRKV